MKEFNGQNIFISIVVAMILSTIVLLMIKPPKKKQDPVKGRYYLNMKNEKIYLLNRVTKDTVYVAPVNYEEPTSFEQALILDNL